MKRGKSKSGTGAEKPKAVMALLLCLAMLAGGLAAVPVQAQAAAVGSLAGVPIVPALGETETVGAATGGPGEDFVTQLGFGGGEWYVVGYNGSGVYSTAGTLTLLQQYRYTTGEQFDTASNEYNGSLLMGVADTAFASGIAFSIEEKAWMLERVLDEVGGTTPAGQKLWPLSGTEAIKICIQVRIGNNFIPAGWWRRSPSTVSAATDCAQYLLPDGLIKLDPSEPGVSVTNPRSVRLAFQLDITDVLLATLADGSDKGMPAGTVLPPFAPPSGGGANLAQMMKLTMKTSALTFSVDSFSVNGDRFDFTYTAAGSYNRLSAVVRAADGSVKHYGRLDTTAAPNASVQLPAGLAPGDTLEVFTEQVNGASFTDLASNPVTLYTQPAPQTPAPPAPAEPAEKGPGSPQTGDDTRPVLWCAAMVAACGGLVALGIARKRRKG